MGESTPVADWVTVAVDAAVVGEPELHPADDRTPGGACAGRVVEAGDDATHLLGKRVAVGPLIPCGQCDVCRRGAVAACPAREVLGQTIDGGLEGRVSARARWLCVLEDELSLDGAHAALVARELAEAYTMYARASVSPGEPVVILGAGARARLLAQVAVASGTAPMVLTSSGRGYREWLEGAGAVAVALAGDATQTQGALLAAAAARGHGSRPWRVFECAGTRDERALALAVAGPGATVAFAPPVLEPDQGPELDGAHIAALDCRIVGVAGAHPDLIPEAAALAIRGDVDLEAACRVIDRAELDDAAQLAKAEPDRALVANLSGTG